MSLENKETANLMRDAIHRASNALSTAITYGKEIKDGATVKRLEKLHTEAKALKDEVGAKLGHEKG